MPRIPLLVLAFALVAVLPPRADAEIYKWVDDNGVPHFADGIDSVPDRYRSRATPVGLKNEPSSTAGASTTRAGSSGGTTINFTPGQRILVDVKINGSGGTRLMLDTGADRTLISPRALQAAGVRLTGPTATGQIVGATGSDRIDFVAVDSLEVGDARVSRMMVGAFNLPTADVGDGLLGRDFLDQFNVNIDSGKGVVTLSPK